MLGVQDGGCRGLCGALWGRPVAKAREVSGGQGGNLERWPAARWPGESPRSRPRRAEDGRGRGKGVRGVGWVN